MKFFRTMIIALVAMCGLSSCSNDCGHDFIEHDYSKDLVGSWSIIGDNHADAIVIKEDGTIEYTGVDNGEYYEGTARFEVVNNRMTIFWDDGAIDEGRLDVVVGSSFSMILDEETGAGYYFIYCYEDLSDEIVGSWIIQSDMTSEIHSYYEDGTLDCLAYYYHLEEQYETLVTGTYKLVGDILFEIVDYGGGNMLAFASRISYTPNGSVFGDVLTSKTYSFYEDELVEEVGTVVRVKQSLDLAGKKYNYSDCNVTNVQGEDTNIEFMGYTFNFAEMDGSGLDVMLKMLFFNIEFDDAGTLSYSYKYNNGEESYDAPIAVEGNKLTIKMSERVPTLKDVVFYAFQNIDCDQLQLCMDKVAFVNFYTNMQAMLREATDKQFDITNAEAVDAIHNEIDNAVETIKLSLEFKTKK